MRYHNFLSDGARWNGFALRPGDIIISPPAKCGTTWTQMICGLVVFQTPEFDRPLDLISPWFDMLTRPRAEVVADLDAQAHRRFIKSHTPLDGLPEGEGVTYICVGRDPRDVAVSFAHHIDNIDFEAFFGAWAATIQADGITELAPPPGPISGRDFLVAWIEDSTPPETAANSLRRTLHHLATFWAARHRDDVVLLHYDDLHADLAGEMHRLAGRLGIDVPEDRWPALVEAATFAAMRRRADVVVPDAQENLWKSSAEFFHRGTSGQWRDAFDEDLLQRYERRSQELAPAGLLTWLHRSDQE